MATTVGKTFLATASKRSPSFGRSPVAGGSGPELEDWAATGVTSFGATATPMAPPKKAQQPRKRSSKYRFMGCLSRDDPQDSFLICPDRLEPVYETRHSMRGTRRILQGKPLWPAKLSVN